ncbi:MAG: hypothetical protein U5K43_13215 [Halofilum sp. (in: g-proteobacteria)]|nr:hypothetical protein [Halofilum sp. (in: g-proteobacteria)]
MLPLLIALQVAGLATALAALLLDLHYAILVAGVALFLVGGHLVRRQIDRRRQRREG